MKKIIILVLIATAIVFGFWYYKSGKTSYESTQPAANNTPITENQMTDTGSTKEFTVVGKNFSFDPTNITVKKGDRVKITFKDSGGFHDLKIDGYNAATQRIKTGQESTVEFLADKTGSFEYYCSVGDHREEGMKGVLVVTE